MPLSKSDLLYGIWGVVYIQNAFDRLGCELDEMGNVMDSEKFRRWPIMEKHGLVVYS